MTYPIPLGKSILQLVCVSALSGYGLFISYGNITRLQQYEKQSEKAAEWSNTAAQRLHKTRTTQTSGTISVRRPSSTRMHV
jgi:outer membrane lipoprotein-sorting protein